MADISPVTGALGAIMRGIDLAAPSNLEFSELRDALDRHLVVYVPDQKLDRHQLSRLGRRFGPPFLHPIVDNGFKDCQEVLELRREPDDTIMFGGESWHADVTWLDPAGYVSILHGQVVPSVGGDTGFSSMIAAFAALSPGMRDMLRGLKAVHSYYGPKGAADPRFTATHPVVRRHPVLGAESLYINRMFAIHFEGMSAEDSRPLIDYLCAHAERHEFTCRFRWQAGGVLLWDNRFTLHYPMNDFRGERRVMIRTTAMES